MERILLVSDTFNAYGVEKIIIWLGKGLSQKGHDVVLCSIYDTEKSCNIPCSLNCYNLGVHHYSNFYINNISYLLVSSWELFKILHKGQFDYVVSFGQNSLIPLAYYKKWFGYKLLLSERNDPYSRASFTENLRKRFYNRADILVFQTSGARDYFSNIIKLKSVVIPNPIVIPEIQWQASNCHNKIISISRLDIRQKRLDVLIEAFAVVHEKFPDYVLEIYGDGPFKKELECLAIKKNVGGTVLFKGVTNYVTDVMITSEIFVLSSDFEGMPNALMEAMALGMPVVSTDCSPGGARALIDDGINGLLVKRGDVKGLALAIERLIRNKEMARECGMEARKKMKDFTPEVILDVWNNCFK